jgi:hypothetical protein
MVVATSSSPPGSRPNRIPSRTAQATQRSSVTLATAAKPMPVVRQTTSRIAGTASMRATAARSASMSSVTASRLLVRSVGRGAPGPTSARAAPAGSGIVVITRPLRPGIVVDQGLAGGRGRARQASVAFR